MSSASEKKDINDFPSVFFVKCLLTVLEAGPGMGIDEMLLIKMPSSVLFIEKKSGTFQVFSVNNTHFITSLSNATDNHGAIIQPLQKRVLCVLQ